MSENVRDLGVVVDSHLCFSEHIANIVRKAHQRANLIHRCFTSKNPDLLVKAFKVYVCPILEFNSPVWSPVTCRGLVLLNWSGSKRECSIIISFRGDHDSTGGCSQVVRLFSTVQGQIPHGGS